MNLGLIFRELSDNLETDIWSRKRKVIEKSLRENLQLQSAAEAGELDGVHLDWDFVLWGIEQCNEGHPATPTISARDTLRFLTERGIAYTGAPRLTNAGTTTTTESTSFGGKVVEELEDISSHLFPLSIIRNILTKHFMGRMNCGRQVINGFMKQLIAQAQGRTILLAQPKKLKEKTIAKTIAHLLRTKRKAATIKAASFIEAQVTDNITMMYHYFTVSVQFFLFGIGAPIDVY